jgi:hypothetical protein
MKRPRRRLFSRAELAGYWLRDYGLALLTTGIFCALAAGLLVWLWSRTAGPERAEQATIVRFGYYDGRWRPRVVVYVRTRDGAIRQLVATPRKLRHCRTGDPIALIRRGAGLFVHSRGCRAAAEIPYGAPSRPRPPAPPNPPSASQ